jgi:hypothetical protein
MQSLNATEIEGEEIQKLFLRGCRVWVCFHVGMCIRHKHHATSCHRIGNNIVEEAKKFLSKYAMNETMC